MATATHELFTHLTGRHTHYGVLPYGRSFDEYVEMFSLEPAEGARRILGVADGPASFNASAAKRGWRVTSLDPIYQFPARTIRGRFHAVIDRMIEGAWSAKPWLSATYDSPAALRAYREQILEAFVDDFRTRPSAYVAGSLPTLPFRNGTFDLAISSYLLFVYTKALDLPFHLRAIAEMLRVAREVRLFPVTPESPYLEPVRSFFAGAGYVVELSFGHSAALRHEGGRLSIRGASMEARGTSDADVV